MEKPWQWFRVVALHGIAKVRHEEQELTRKWEQSQDVSKTMPLVDQQLRHNRIQELSLGLSPDEKPVGVPHAINWASHLPQLRELGLALDFRYTVADCESMTGPFSLPEMTQCEPAAVRDGAKTCR